MINNLCKEAYETAESKKLYEGINEMGTLLSFIHSEVSEALEADRRGNNENFIEELADVCIMTFSICGLMGIDLEQAILDKMKYNKTRPVKHGGKLY